MADPANRQSKVFISYSRKDKTFVKKLNDSLDKAGVAAWVDWEGIPPSADWMAEITRAIQEADAFVFVISPDSLASKVCMDELELGIQYNKKLIPVLFRDKEKRTKMHPKLSSTNWIYLRKQDNYKNNLPKIFDAINTDLEWTQGHTRLLQRATEWEQKNKSNSYLLTGGELDEGEKWLMASTSDVNRQVAPVQAEYLSTSRKIAVRRQRNITISIGVALVLSILMGIYAFQQRGVALENEEKARASQATAEAQRVIAEENKKKAEDSQKIAEEKAREAAAQRSAAEAKNFQSIAGELDTSTLLAIDAYNNLPNLREAEDTLRQNIALLAVPVKQMNVGDRIWSIQLNPDKSKFATADSTGKACLWSTTDGTQYFCAQHEGIVYDTAFSSDGQILITGTEKGVVTFWNANTGEEISSLKFDGTIWDLNMNPNGRWLGVGRTNAVSIIDMTKLREEIFFTQNGEVYTIDFDDTGAYMAFGTSEGYVSIWTVMTSRTVSGGKHTNEVYDLDFSPDSKWVVSGGADSTARGSFIATGGQKYFVQHGDWVEDVTFGPDPSWFATVSDDKILRVIRTDNGQEKMRMTHEGFIQKVRVSRDGQWIASSGYDKTVRVWDALTGAQVLQLPINGIGSSLYFNGDNTRLIAGDRSGNIYLWDISNLKAREGIMQFSEYTHEAHYSPDGTWAIVNTDDKNIYAVQKDQLGLPNGIRKVITKAKGLTYNTAISPNGQWVAAVEYDSNVASYNRIILVKPDGSDLHFLDHGGSVVNTFVFSPTSNEIFTSDENGKVIVWDVNTRKQLYTLETEGGIITLGISPDGRYLAAGTEEGNQNVVWDLTTKQVITELVQFGNITAIQFSHDGNILATSDSEGSLYLWDVQKDFKRIENNFKSNGEITYLDFNPNDKWLAVGNASGYVYIWDLSLNQEIARLPHGDEITSVSFSPDGSQLAAVSNKSVLLWKLDAIQRITRENLVDEACKRLTTNFTQEKWKTLFFDEEYHLICPNLPAGGN